MHTDCYLVHLCMNPTLTPWTLLVPMARASRTPPTLPDIQPSTYLRVPPPWVPAARNNFSTGIDQCSTSARFNHHRASIHEFGGRMPALTDNDGNAMNLSGSQPPTSVLAPDGSQVGTIDRITELQDGVGTLPNLALLRLR